MIPQGDYLKRVKNRVFWGLLYSGLVVVSIVMLALAEVKVVETSSLVWAVAAILNMLAARHEATQLRLDKLERDGYLLGWTTQLIQSNVSRMKRRKEEKTND